MERIPLLGKDFIKRKIRRQNTAISFAVVATERIMKSAINGILTHGILTNGHYNPPSLYELYYISEKFYRKVIEASYASCEDEKKTRMNKKVKKMAKLPVGLPQTLPQLEKFFRDKRYWPKIVKRSKLLTDKLRKSYLEKLEKKFNIIIPKLRNGEITVNDAKKELMDAWKASKPRVELIFRTETTNYFAKTQISFFNDDPDVIGYMFDAIVDNDTTKICRVRDGLIYTKDYKGKESIKYNTPALHYNCRSHLVTLYNIDYDKRLLKDESLNPRHRKAEVDAIDKKFEHLRFKK